METVAKLATMDMDGKHETYASQLAHMNSHSDHQKYRRDVEDGRTRARQRVLYNTWPTTARMPKGKVSNLAKQRGFATSRQETCWIGYTPEKRRAPKFGDQV